MIIDSSQVFAKVRTFEKYLGKRIYKIILLVVLTSLADGFGILLLVPVLQGVDGGSGGALAPVIDRLRDLVILFFGESQPQYLILLIAILFTVKGIFNFKALSYSSRLRAELIVALKQKIYETFRNVHYQYYAQQQLGEMANLLNEHVARALQSFHFFTLVLIQLANLIISLVICLALSPSFGVILIIIGLLLQLVFRRLNEIVLMQARKTVDANNALMGRFIEFLTNYKYLVITNNKHAFNNDIRAGVEILRASQRKLGDIESITQSVREPVAILVVSLVIVIHIVLFNGDLAEVMVSVLVLYRAMNAMVQLQSFRQTSLNNFVSLDLIDKKLSEMSESSETDDVSRRSESGGVIQFNGVGFTYGNNITALHNIDLIIQPRSTTAIIGKSGSGKSTLVELIALLRRHTSGLAFIGDTPVADVDKQSWRSSLGYVGQDCSVFEDTLANNITLQLGRTLRYSEEEAVKIYNVLARAGLVEYVDSQASGIYTKLFFGGKNMSGGQRQRLLIARELFREPRFLIMDEATSALDAQTESLVNDTIVGLKGAVTIIIVAHKMSAIRVADNVIVLENGTIVERGSFAELIANNDSRLSALNLG